MRLLRFSIRRASALLAVLAVIGLGVWFLAALPARHPDARPTRDGLAGTPCRTTGFETTAYVVCVVDPAANEIRLAHASGEPGAWSDVAGFVDAAARRGARPLLAMNAGMYHADFSPVGLLVEDGRQVAPLNRAEGTGNFFLKPNGVFFLDEKGRAGVMETGAYAAARIAPRIATQSGPLLVEAGALHPRFLPDGTSRYIRNGIGVRSDGRVVLALSLEPVNLHGFARAFRDGFGCPDALFLDGDVSALHAGGRLYSSGEHPAGPVIAVY